jgi:hypothetical protein
VRRHDADSLPYFILGDYPVARSLDEDWHADGAKRLTEVVADGKL